MRTNADLAARLLREAATIFRSMGDTGSELGPKLAEFAGWYDRIAELVERDPTGELQSADGSGRQGSGGAAS